MERRNFVKTATLLGGAALTASLTGESFAGDLSNAAQFKLKYAPGIDMFSASAGSKDFAANLQFIKDQGFKAVFDNDFPKRSKEDQDTIANLLNKLGLEFGPYVLYADFSKESMVLKDENILKMLKERIEVAKEIKKRTGYFMTLMVPGRYSQNVAWDYQAANVIDNLRELSAMAQAEGIVIVLEPLNLYDHPGLFLSGSPQAYMICRAVNSPSCKIIFDVYHQQITEGNIIPNLKRCWSEIGTMHCGDNPGRKEPTTGEINYRGVFKFLYEKGYNGAICMEHGKSKQGKEGDQAVIDAYRFCDNF